MTDDLSSPRCSPFLSLSVSRCRLLNGYIRSSVTASEKLRRYFPNILTYLLARSPSSNLLYRTYLVGPSHSRNVLMVFLTHRSSRYFQRLGDMGCTFQSETSSLEHLTLSFGRQDNSGHWLAHRNLLHVTVVNCDNSPIGLRGNFIRLKCG